MKSSTTPAKAIRLFVLDYNHGNRDLVKLGDVPPTLRPYRFGKNPTEAERAEYGPDSPHGDILPKCKAIRAWCLECSGGSAGEVRDCRDTGCHLWPYRLGKNPAHKGNGDASRFAAKPPAATVLTRP